MSKPELNTIKSGGLQIERRKSCESCLAEFSCYTSNCWCNDLPNIMPLDEKRGCLCPACLEKVIAQKIKNHKPNE